MFAKHVHKNFVQQEYLICIMQGVNIFQILKTFS